MKVFLRAPFNYDVDKASDEAGLRCLDVSRTQQQFKEEVDINTIVKRFGLDGAMPQDVRMPQYGDFTGIGDFREAMECVRLAGEAFDEMPARIRARFDHDPAKFVDFCLQESNAAEAATLGLVKPEVLERQARELAETARLLEVGRTSEKASKDAKGDKGAEPPALGST